MSFPLILKNIKLRDIGNRYALPIPHGLIKTEVLELNKSYDLVITPSEKSIKNNPQKKIEEIK